VAVRAQFRDPAALKTAAAVTLVAAGLAACSSSPPPPEWRANAFGALQSFERNYLGGNTAAGEADFRRARAEIGATGRLDLAARAELVRCAVRVASLEFDNCPGFEALRHDAAPAELAYAEYLAGRAARPGAAAPAEEALSKLVAAGVQMRAASLPPQGIAAAVEIASAQGWRRPLLAWLGVQLERARQAGDGAAAAQIERRMRLASSPSGG
jgi:hypothetical protein